MPVGGVESEADLERFVQKVLDNRPRGGTPVAPGFHVYPAIDATGAPVLSVFVDQADGILKFKDGGGTLHALY